MNLICITESELAQWTSRRYLDALSSRVLTGYESINTDVFCTSPYLKLDDARGRIIVNLKDHWQSISTKINTSKEINCVSIPLDAIQEIAPTMDQYAKRLATYQLPIAQWSVEKIWDEWLVTQAVMEIHRAIASETSKIGCLDRDFLSRTELINAIIKMSLRPDEISNDGSLLLGWSEVFTRRDSWLQWLRVNGHLDNTSMLKATAEKVSTDLDYLKTSFSFEVIDADKGWSLQDITEETLAEFNQCDLEKSQESKLASPPLLSIAAYLRMYDEIHNGGKDWRVVFNLLRFTKYSVSTLHADIIAVALLASLKPDEIYSIGLKEIYTA